MSAWFSRLPRSRALALCALPVAALLAVAGTAPLPYTVAQPGSTSDVLGEHQGEPVITVSGTPVRRTDGKLLMTTILATGPDADVDLGDVVDGWFRTDRAVLPKASVYPPGQTVKEIEKRNLGQMAQSQNSAVTAALGYLKDSAQPPKDLGQIKVDLRLADVGGPSAGLFFALGIVDKIRGDGSGGDLTGGRTIAGTGTVDDNGEVGPVGGVSLKTQAAHRDGATVFLVPQAECGEAEAELPAGMRLIPVDSVAHAVNSLTDLAHGKAVPSC
ncbi:S16 family serine protease [Streptomyces sp. NPDC046887]|uniref:S16 family serine protease n=1 Tax=Streptomyces sp. NPDC046887 TaxID=3155472 RepID=UPI0033CEB753